MTPPNLFQVCSPAEELQPSRGVQRLARRARRGRRSITWKLSTWNMRSMVDTEGPVKIASQRADSHRGEDRKVNLIVNELRRYDVKVAALQETKWFGSEVYYVSASVVLTAGRKNTRKGTECGERIRSCTSSFRASCRCLEERRQPMVSMEFQSSVSLPASGKRGNRQVACGVMLRANKSC